jgi:biopolymer transport protein TolR
MSMGASTAVRRGRRRRRRRRSMSDINVTPLVDVMLVLLVIFIITAPALKDAIDVDLPKAKGDGVTRGMQPRIQSVVVDSAGKVHVADRTLNPAEISIELPKLLKGHENEAMMLKASRQLSFETVVKVMSIMRGAGIKGISVAVDAIPVGR